jgi:hypothetical protein
MMLLGGATIARAQENPLPPVADVVAHARAVMEKKVELVVCKVVVDTQLLDKTGKPEHDEHREGKATLRGDDQDIETASVVRDGKAMSAEEIADERAKVQRDKQKAKKKNKGGDDDFDVLSPLAAKNAANQSFELVRKEALWGRQAYVLKVRAQKASPEASNGTMWIDAEKFVELKSDLVPSEMPPHADWIKVQMQYVPGPKDVALPSYLHIEGAGHMLFMHKQFRTTLRWSDCR